MVDLTINWERKLIEPFSTPGPRRPEAPGPTLQGPLLRDAVLHASRRIRTISHSRRYFLRSALRGLAALPFFGLTLEARAVSAEAGLPKLAEDDPEARALGYVQDAGRADATRFAQRSGPESAQQLCRRCQFFSAAGDSAWGTCVIFPERLVNADRWCSNWYERAE